ncbi:hypothetical protein ABPG72_015672 [Tetrahymena utriculariae]
MSDQIEEQKNSSSDQQNTHKDQKLDLSFVHISTNLGKKKVLLEPALKNDTENKNGQKKCNLFKIDQGKQLIYNCLQEIYTHNNSQEVQVNLKSENTASYMLIQALADLQFNGVLTIVKTSNQTTGESYGIEVSVIFNPDKDKEQPK